MGNGLIDRLDRFRFQNFQSPAYRSKYTLTDILVYTPNDKLLYPRLQTYTLGYSLPNKS